MRPKETSSPAEQMRCPEMGLGFAMDGELSAFSSLPKQQGYRRPTHGGTCQCRARAVADYERLDQPGEYQQSNSSDRGTGGIHSGRLSSACESVEAGALFLLHFMLFDQCRARGKDRGKGQEEAANPGAESVGDQARKRRNQSSEKEAKHELVPAGLQ